MRLDLGPNEDKPISSLEWFNLKGPQTRPNLAIIVKIIKYELLTLSVKEMYLKGLGHAILGNFVNYEL